MARGPVASGRADFLERWRRRANIWREPRPARFTALETEFTKGLDKVKPVAGAKPIDDWLGELKVVEVAGVRDLTHDLESLKTQLEADAPDAGKIGPLLGRIGAETGRIAARVADETVAAKLKPVAQMLEPFHTV